MGHDCKYEEWIGEAKAFINSFKGFKSTLFVIALTILLQVGTFLYLWGGLTTTVKIHDENIHNILNKLDRVKFIGYLNAEEVMK